MKLEIECVRDVLLELESLPLDCHTVYSFTNSIQKHGEENVAYALAKLSEAEYINANIELFAGRYECFGVYDMTFDGHQFLETIRENKVWNRTKAIIGKVGSGSFGMISQIASSILSELVSACIKGQV